MLYLSVSSSRYTPRPVVRLAIGTLARLMETVDRALAEELAGFVIGIAVVERSEVGSFFVLLDERLGSFHRPVNGVVPEETEKRFFAIGANKLNHLVGQAIGHVLAFFARRQIVEIVRIEKRKRATHRATGHVDVEALPFGIET